MLILVQPRLVSPFWPVAAVSHGASRHAGVGDAAIERVAVWQLGNARVDKGAWPPRVIGCAYDVGGRSPVTLSLAEGAAFVCFGAAVAAAPLAYGVALSLALLLTRPKLSSLLGKLPSRTAAI